MFRTRIRFVALVAAAIGIVALTSAQTTSASIPALRQLREKDSRLESRLARLEQLLSADNSEGHPLTGQLLGSVVDATPPPAQQRPSGIR